MDAKKADIIKALANNRGLVMPSCLQTNTPRSTFYDWLKKDEEFAREVAEVQDVAVDFAEEKLLDLIDQGDTTATIFLLKTRGKKRGYVERMEVDNLNPVPVINIDPLSDADDSINATTDFPTK